MRKIRPNTLCKLMIPTKPSLDFIGKPGRLESLMQAISAKFIVNDAFQSESMSMSHVT